MNFQSNRRIRNARKYLCRKQVYQVLITPFATIISSTKIVCNNNNYVNNAIIIIPDQWQNGFPNFYILGTYPELTQKVGRRQLFLFIFFAAKCLPYLMIFQSSVVPADFEKSSKNWKISFAQKTKKINYSFKPTLNCGEPQNTGLRVTETRVLGFPRVIQLSSYP